MMESGSNAVSAPPAQKAGWITAYILKRGQQYRVSIVDAPTSDGWTIFDEQSVCVEASTDLEKLKDEIDRRCQPPLSQGQAMALVAALRGHVLDQPVGGNYSTVDLIDDKYSTLWRRFFARWIDGVLFAPLGFLYFYVFSHPTPIPVRLLAAFIGQGAFVVYSIWMHGKYGQTLGKMVCKVIVLDVSEQPLKMSQAALRDIFIVVLVSIELALEIPRIAQGIDITTPENRLGADRLLWYVYLAWFVVEVVTLLANKKRRALHDYIAGSVVVRWR
jgi:uncharacterized RDD family membrane protein YckC